GGPPRGSGNGPAAGGPSTGSGNASPAGTAVGREFNSGDVKFSYEYHGRTGDFEGKKLPAGTFNFMLEGLEGIDTPDASTAVVRFKEGFVPFLNYSASFRIPIVPREIFDRDGHLKDAIAGTGPFQLDPAASQRGSQFTW